MESYEAYISSDYSYDWRSGRPLVDYYTPRFTIEKDANDLKQFFFFLQYSNLLPYQLFNGDFMEGIRAKVKKEAKRWGYELLSKSLEDSYRLPVSYLITEDHQLLLVIHWPALNSATSNKVYAAEAIPTALPSSHDLVADGQGFMMPELYQELVIINSATSEKEFYPVDLVGSCNQATHGSFLCDDFFFLKNQPLKMSCLKTLLSEDHDRLRADCILSTIPLVDWAMHTHQGEHIVFTTSDKSNLICNGKTLSTTGIVIPNVTQSVSLPMGCGLELASKSLWSGFVLEDQPESLELLVKLNLELLGSFTWPIIKNDARIILGYICEVIWELRWNMLGYFVIFVIAVILVAVAAWFCHFVYLCYSHYQELRRQGQEQIQAGLQALAVLRRRCNG